MNKVIVIVGPTAIGKTKISIELAKRFNLDIISGDSVAVYKKLDIGSAKPTIEEMDGVVHHLIDILDVDTQYSVNDFQKDARKIIEDKKDIIICGGTGLYIQSALFDYNFEASKRSEDTENEFLHLSNEQLYDILLNLDKDVDQTKIHPNNRKRVLRAIEVKRSTNKSISSFVNKKTKMYDHYIVYLNIDDRDLLYDRINKRVDQMVEMGLIDEVRNLYESNEVVNAIGYKEFIPYFEGLISLECAIEEIKKNSRHLAKRQITWFKNQMDSNFYNVNLNDIYKTVDEIYNDLKIFMEK